MALKVRAARLGDVKGYNVCFAAVASERRWLGMVNGLPLERSREWMKTLLGAKCPFYVAVDGKRIVGWCDAGPRDVEGFRHTVGLGMGLLPEARRRGLGAQLLLRTIAHCRRRRIEKIELQVFASNRAARAMYRKFGFKQEGRRVRGRKLDGEYDDVIIMGLIL